VCERVDIGNGTYAIVCTRGHRQRCKCGRPSTKLCDYPLSGAKAGKTCSRPMCDGCSTRVGSLDYCRPHAEASGTKQPARGPVTRAQYEDRR